MNVTGQVKTVKKFLHKEDKFTMTASNFVQEQLNSQKLENKL